MSLRDHHPAIIGVGGGGGPSTQFASNDFEGFEGFEVTDALLNFQPDTFKLRTDEKYCGFDNNVGESWIYPTNYPMRKYQYEITKIALFKNTLVVLPTGLGKTFLAAVVMYNFYRWYPRGKVIFMAPTRPLVAQQIEACYQIMGIPKCDTLELTGKQQKEKRLAGWKSHRVFFVTPQVLAIDLCETDFPINEIKLIVVDEAHKAKGKYAYTEVVRIISQQNRYFRVLALSATPGRQLSDVAEIVRNLIISHIEVRSESSPDVEPYTYKKNIQTIVVRLNESIREIRNHLMDIISPYVESLINQNVIQGSLLSLTKGWLVMQQKTFVSQSCQRRHPEHSLIMANFAVCISLYHALELLERHGVRIFLNFFDNCDDKYYLTRDADLMSFLYKIRETIGTSPLDTTNNLVSCTKDLDFGHPKYEILKNNLIKHFQQNPDTKAMIFCEFRESVQLVNRLLRHLEPLIRSQVFIGQGVSNGGGSGANTSKVLITQKQQIETMNSFRQGIINVLIATCVAEEGIDVGEIDLIVCFDISTKNPIRLVQRIGRTGRRRDGKVIMLVTEGKEQTILKDVMAAKDLTNRKISECQEIRNELFNSPRMVPTEFDPRCIETYIKIDGVIPLVKQSELINNGCTVNGSETIETMSTLKKNRKNNKNMAKNNKLRDVRQYFKPINKESDNIQELANVSISSIDYNNTIQDIGSGNIENDAKNSKTQTENIDKHQQVLNKLQQVICESKRPNLHHNTQNIKICKDFFQEHSEFYKYLINPTKFDGIFKDLTNVEVDELNMTEKCIDEDEYEDDQCEKNDNSLNISNIKNQYQNTQTPQFIELDSKYKSQWTTIEENKTNPVRNLPNEILKTHLTSTPIRHQTTSMVSKVVENMLMDDLKKPNGVVEPKKETPTKNIELVKVKQKVKICPAMSMSNVVENKLLDHLNSPNRHLEPNKETPTKTIEVLSVNKKVKVSLVTLTSKVVENKLLEPKKVTPLKNIELLRIKQEVNIENPKQKCDIKDVLSYFRLSSVWELFVPSRQRCDNDLTTNLDKLNKSLRKNAMPDDVKSVETIEKVETQKTNDEQSFIAASPQKSNRLITKLHRKRTTPTVKTSLKVPNSTITSQIKTYIHPEEQNNILNLFNESFSVDTAFNNINCDNNNQKHSSSDNHNLLNKDIDTSKNKLIDVGHLDDIFCDSNDDEDDEFYHIALNKSKNVIIEQVIPAKRQKSKDLFDITVDDVDELSSSLKENNVPINLSQNITTNNLNINSIESPNKLLDKKSPSAINRRLNFSRLKTAHLKQINSMPVNVSAKKSLPPIFQANTEQVPCKNQSISPQNSDKDIKNKDFQINRLNLQEFQYQPSRIADESSFFTNPKKKPIIKLNYSDDHDDDNDNHQNQTNISNSSSSDDDDFESSIKKSFKIISPSLTQKKTTTTIKFKSKKRKKNPYLLDECNVSDVDGISSDESDGPTQFIKHDSICVTDDDADELKTQNPEIDMQAKYLQSIKSPIRKPIRGFHIPEIKNLPHYSHPNDNLILENDNQEDDSFVVTNDSDIENVINNTLCPLEKAEKILKQRKREAKRKRRGIGEDVISYSTDEDNKIEENRKRKRRKILPTIISSDEENVS